MAASRFNRFGTRRLGTGKDGEGLDEASFGTNAIGFSGTVMSANMNDTNQSRSVLFAGVAGSVRLHEKLGGDEAMRAVDRCLTRMERAAEAFGGRIIKRAGDELMVVFDVPDEAFQAATEMRQRVADLPPVSGVKLAIRIGFSHGLVSEADGSIVGEAVVEAAGLAGLAMPGQVLSSHHAYAALSPALKGLTRDLGSASAKGISPKGIAFEVVTQGAAALETKKPGDPEEHQGDKPKDGKLHLRYGNKRITLDDSKPVITMGRDPQCDIVVHDRRASRNHARIELRGERIVVIDTSTNGTYVTLHGKPELFLRKEECGLYSKGIICFAGSATSAGADFAEFDLS